jgi:exodeoxyribonuclease-5
VKFAAFTGKAALVMRNKGCDNASTIHSLIYRARESGVEQPSFELWDDAPASKAKLIVIDECSMVDAELGRDLMSFECPLLVLGDPAQLPPIQGGGFFTDCEPDAMLTEVHPGPDDRSCGCRWTCARAANSTSAAMARARWWRATSSIRTG